MDITVIIPTYKRKKQVLETIKLFSGQTYQKFEMVVVDQGPARIFDKELSDLGVTFPLKYVRLDEPGLGKARNAGIAAATSFRKVQRGASIYALTCWAGADCLSSIAA